MNPGLMRRKVRKYHRKSFKKLKDSLYCRANLVQLLAGFQAGRGLGQGPCALDLPLGDTHRAVVGQHS